MDTTESDLRSLLGRSLLQKYLTHRLLRFVDEQGIVRLLSDMQRFDIEDIAAALQLELGYNLQDGTRYRMVKLLIDLLFECDFLENEDGFFLWKRAKYPELRISEDEAGLAKTVFKGQIDFFEECISYSDKFLRGSPPLYNFDAAAINVWEKFLGNAEYRFARSVLVRLLLSGRRKQTNVLDLCYGPGFDIPLLQEQAPDVRVTALDHGRVSEALFLFGTVRLTVFYSHAPTLMCPRKYESASIEKFTAY